MASKLYALKGEKFDISKVTVVGSPTIMSDGVASGFSSENKIYAKVCDGYDLSAHTYTLKLHLPKASTAGVNTSGVPFRLLGSWVQLNVNGTVSLLGTGSSANVGLSTTQNAFQDGDDIDLIIQWKYNNYSIRMSVNGGEYGGFTQTGNTLGVQSTTIMQSIYLGSNANYSPYQDEIPLTSVEFYIDNQLVFQPVKPTYLLERRKEGYDPSKFTVVGSPTITEYGVASGLDRTNYIRTTGISFTETDTWKMKLSFIINSNTQESFTLLNFESANYRRIYIIDNYIFFQFYTTQDYFVKIPLVLDAKYKCKWGWDGSKLYCKYSIDGGEEILVSTNLDTGYTLENKGIWLGYSYVHTNNIIEGSIDLPSISFTVGNKEVFTGAKEKFYAFEGGK